MNEIPIYLIVLPVVFSLIATYTDLLRRMIYDWLNYGSLIISTIIAVYFKQNLFDYGIFIIASFVFAYIIYKMGGWAGGDVKFFTALSAWFAIFSSVNPIYIIAVFLSSVILVIPVAFAVYWKRIWKNKSIVVENIEKSKNNAIWGAFTTAIGAAVYNHSPVYSLIVGLFASVLAYKRMKIPYIALAIGSIFISWQLYLSGLLIGFAVTFVSSIMIGSFLELSPKVLRTSKEIEKLQEGDIPYTSIYLNEKNEIEFWNPPNLTSMIKLGLKMDAQGLKSISPPKNAIVDCLDAGGLTNEQIVQLKKMKTLKEIIIKESLPYAPSMILGFAIVAVILKLKLI